MSAYVVGKYHIDSIIRTALEGPKNDVRWDRDIRWYTPDESERFGYRQHRLTLETASEVGQMLLDENVVSVGYRYNDSGFDDLPGPIDTSYRSPYRYTPGRRLNIGEALQAIDGLDYQSCEHPGWKSSEALTFLNMLRSRLWSSLPEYGAADTWEVDPPERATA